MSDILFNIIQDLEEEFGIELDSNWDAGVNSPCNGDNCRSEECVCWENFQWAVRKQLEEQRSSMREVSACCLNGLTNAGVLWEASCIECGKYDPDTVWI